MSHRILVWAVLAAGLVLTTLPGSVAAGGPPGRPGQVIPGVPWGSYRSQWGPKPWYPYSWWPRAWWTPYGWMPWTPAVPSLEPDQSLKPWYRCLSTGQYFPDQLDCPEGWTEVLPEPVR